jgi:enoyl-CoA hydratase
MTETGFERIRYDEPATGVARVTLARADRHNAQDRKMLYEIDAAFARAVRDDDIKVIVLAAEGPNFSAGHDIAETDPVPMDELDTVTLSGSFTEPGAHGRMAREQEFYLGLCWRWRNLSKPIIAQAQGKTIAGGLMLLWPCDIIIASTDATFSDPVVAFGVNGHEYFTHVWEVGHRTAREMLYRGHALSAEEAHLRGMVNHVVPLDELESFTLGIASEIALQPAVGLKLAKLAVNQSLDAQGQWNALQAAFALHTFGHTFAETQFGFPIDPAGLEAIRRRSASNGNATPLPSPATGFSESAE